MRPDQIWQAALGELQLQLTKSAFDMWLRDTVLLSSDDDVFVLGVKNDYTKDWLESRLMSTLKRTLAGITGQATEARVVVYGDSHSLAADEPTDIEPEEVWEPDWRDIGVPLIFENETLEDSQHSD
jgi:chromosomal replication initiator protein